MNRCRNLAAGTLLFLTLWKPMVGGAPFNSDEGDDARDIIVRAYSLTNLRSEGSKPFRLQAHVQLYDAKKHKQEGTYILLWNSPTAWRDETRVGDFSQVRSADGNRLYLTRTPLALSPGAYHLLRLLEFPNFPIFPHNRIWGVTGTKEGEHRGERKIELRISGKIYKTIYLNNSTGVPTRVEYESVEPKLSYVYEQYAAFDGHQFPGVLTELNPGAPPIRIEVQQLEEVSLDPSSLAPPPDAKWMPWCPNPVPPALQEMPSLFFPARSGHLPTSAIYVIVGPDGRLHNVSVVRSIDQDVDAVLLKSMGNWRYIPAKCGGDSVPWEMVIEFPTEGIQLIE